MWEYRHPESPCFTAHCKPKPRVLSKNLKQGHQFGDVFMGRKLVGTIQTSCDWSHKTMAAVLLGLL